MEPRRPIPPILVSLVVAIAIVNALANKHYWYWTMKWFDMPMHFAGGVWLAGFAIWFRFFSGQFKTAEESLKSYMYWGVGSAFGVGLGWEVYEAVVGLLTKGHMNAMSDTLSDLSFDILGGLAVALGVWISRKK